MNAMVKNENKVPAINMEQVVIEGDLSTLSPNDRVIYYKNVCDSLGINPLTKPFEYIKLNGKLTLYVKKDGTEQLRKIHEISIHIVARELVENVYIVTARATDKTGRCDEAIGAVSVVGLKGEAMANAIMKAETKAKRRVTLSISGLGMLDETELSSIPGAAQLSDDFRIADLQKELSTLITTFDIKKEVVEKWLKWGHVSDLKDLSEPNLIKLINGIKQNAAKESE